ncbi:MAG: hypothetical protein M3Y58_16045 [Chloroflexota bacterium]|nr:hypothetical protein [Chloroflexota bacterium]
MTNDAQDADPGMIAVERCPVCGTLMTAERAGPIRFANPAQRMILPDAQISGGQSVTRMQCENGHTFWAIEDEEEE